MVGGKPELYYSAIKGFFDGTHDWDTDDHYAVLVTASYTPSLSHSTFADISTYEVVGGSYSPVNITGESVIINGNSIECDSNDVLFPLGTYTAKYIVILKGTASTKSSTDELICYAELNVGGTLSTSSKAMLVRWGPGAVFIVGKDNSVIEISDWNSRPTSAVSGDLLEYTPTGVHYRWESTIGEWIRVGFFDGGAFALRGRIDGDTLPASEFPAWTETTSGGTITVDTGGAYDKVKFSTGATPGNTAYASLNTVWSGVTPDRGCVGWVQLNGYTGTGTNATRILAIEESEYLAFSGAVGSSSGVGGFSDTGGLYSQSLQGSFGLWDNEERWVEIYFYDNWDGGAAGKGNAVAFIDHLPYPYAAVQHDQLTSAAVDRILVGDFTGNGSGDMWVRDFKAFEVS